MIELNPYRCTRTVSKSSECMECVNSCPTDSLSLTADGKIYIEDSSCVDCGACIGVCPTEALSLKDFSPLELFFSQQKNPEPLSCSSNIPCLASISSSYLLSYLSYSSSDIVAEIGGCSSCKIFEGVGEQISRNIEEANFLAEAFNVDKRIVYSENGKPFDEVEVSRRGILKNFQQKSEVEFSGDSVKNGRGATDGRKLLLMAINKLGLKSPHNLSTDDVTNFSDKTISDECTNCQICYRICPTEALSSDYKNSFIKFNPSLCVACGLCHSVCEPEAITQKDVFSLKSLVSPKPEKLIEFNIRKCYECDSYFTYSGSGAIVCHRCQIEEQQAMELHGF